MLRPVGSACAHRSVDPGHRAAPVGEPRVRPRLGRGISCNSEHCYHGTEQSWLRRYPHTFGTEAGCHPPRGCPTCHVANLPLGGGGLWGSQLFLLRPILR
jgi:hypothetical protein